LNQQNPETMKRNKSLWGIWAKSLGHKASKCNKESDKVALIRTIIFATYLITNCFIVAGVIRHWNDVDYSNSPSEVIKCDTEF
jgi:hypothetical protein